MKQPPTLLDLIADGARRLSGARVCIGHLHDNALDEARSLVLHALDLPNDWPAHLARARLLPEEVTQVQQLFDLRVEQRIPAAYLIGRAEFAGLSMKTDHRALVPRSPIAELILGSFQSLPRPVQIDHALDLCTGGGSIALAMAAHHPHWRVDAADLSPDALALAAENCALLGLEGQVSLLQSDLFDAIPARRYDLIVSNPPYLTMDEYQALPAEYAHEPEMALPSGADGLDITFRILDQAPDFLTDDGLLVVEIGEAERTLRGLVPDPELRWISFSVGAMGVFAITRADLLTLKARYRGLFEKRARRR